MSTMDKKKSYCSNEQKNVLVELLQKDKALICGKFSNTFTFKDAQRKWENIADTLNAIPGASKDWKQWRKAWQDIRCKTKQKQAQLNKYTQATGGGPPPQDNLTEIEKKETYPPHTEAHEDNIEVVNVSNTVNNNANLDIENTPLLPKKKKSTAAGSRLAASATATESLVELSRRKLMMKEEYHKKKLALLERQVLALENVCDALRVHFQ